MNRLFYSSLCFFSFFGFLFAQIPVPYDTPAYAESWIQVKEVSTNIRAHGFKSSRPLYLALPGFQYKVNRSSLHFYEVIVTQNIKGWLSKSHVRSIQKPTSSISQSLIRLPYSPPIYAYTYPEHFVFPRQNRMQYFDLDITGFHEIKFSGRDYNPKNPSDPRFDRIRRDPLYTKLPRDVFVGPMKMDIRYAYQIDGQLDKNLFIHFDVDEKDPDFPGKYEVNVKHKDKELSFWNFDAQFNNGDFVNLKKSLNGVKGSIKDDKGDALFTIGKERSHSQKVVFNGSNKKKYLLKNKHILQDSVIVYVNNQKQNEHTDYTVNYFEGYILFHNPKVSSDLIKVIYESSNPIMDFLPMLARKNFMGFQYKYESKDRLNISKKTSSHHIVFENTSTQNQVVFDLPHKHIQLSSDSVYRQGLELVRNEEYMIKNHDGKLLLFTPLIPSESVTIDYNYFHTTSSTLTLIGQNSSGPYDLNTRFIIRDSLTVRVHDNLLRESKDYIVDYDEGTIVFSYDIAYPQIISVHFDHIDYETKVKKGKEKPFKIGVSYLKEYVLEDKDRKIISVDEESVISTINNTNNDGFLFSTQFNPIITENLSIDVGGVTLAENQFTVLSTYKGLIKLNQNPSSSVHISYQYQTGQLTRYSFIITPEIDQQQNAYINYEHFYLTQLPVKYQGIHRIELFNGVETLFLEENKEFLIDYQDGVNLSITFKTPSDTDPNDPNKNYLDSKLNRYPQPGDQITLVYDFIDDTPIAQKQLEQNMFNIQIGSQLTNHWHILGEIAGANHNFQNQDILLDPPLIMKGNGQDHYNYSLTHQNIIENSEEIYINNQLQQIDIDYYINYKQGTIRFINSPQESDEIKATFRYFDTHSPATISDSMDYHYASKIKTGYHSDALDFSASFQSIDRDFQPIGSISEEKGTDFFETHLKWHLLPQITVNWDHRNTLKHLDSNKQSYSKRDYVSTEANLTLLKILETSSKVHYQFDVASSDSNQVSNNHSIDDLTYGYSTSISTGPDYFQNHYSYSFSESISDYLDRHDLKSSQSYSNSFSSSLFLKNVWFFNTLKLSPLYSNSVAQSFSADTRTNQSLREKKQISTTMTPFSHFKQDASYSYETTHTKSVSHDSGQHILNTLFNTLYTPRDWFHIMFKNNINQKESSYLNQKGDIYETNTFSLSPFKPFYLFKALNMNVDTWYFRPIQKSHFDFSINYNESINNNARQNTNVDNYSLNVNQIDFSPHLTLQKLALSQSQTDYKNTVTSSSVSQNSSHDYQYSSSGQLVYRPKQLFFHIFELSYLLKKNNSLKTNFDYSNLQNKISSTQKPSEKKEFSLHMKETQLVVPYFNKKLSLGYYQITWNDVLENQDSLYTLNITPLISSSNLYQDIFPYDTINRNHKHSNDMNLNYRTRINLFNFGTLTGTLKLHKNFTKTEEKKIFYQLKSDLFNLQQTFPDSPLTFDQRDYHERHLSLNSTPFSLFSFSSQFLDKNGLISFSRSLDDEEKTSTNDYSLSSTLSFSLFKFLTLSTTGSVSNKNEYQSNNLSLSSYQIQHLSHTDQSFKKEQHTKQIDLNQSFSIRFFSYLSFNGGYNHRFIKENFIVPHQNSHDLFKQDSFKIGTKLTPLPKLNINLDYNLHFSNRNEAAIQKGYTTQINATYKPFSKKNYHVYFTYSRVENWGSNFNTLTDSTHENLTGSRIQTTLVKRNDIVQTGSLKIDINIPIPSMLYMDSIVITGEGFLKKVDDKKDVSNISTDDFLNSYNISGLILKGTLLF